MSVYTQFDKDGPCLQVASNKGWGEFTDFVEELKSYPRITQLVDSGSTEEITEVRGDLEELLEKEPPENKDVLATVHQLIHNIDEGGKAEILLITNGVTT